jgi:hypothetical protein
MNNSDYYEADRLNEIDNENVQNMDVEDMNQPISKPYSSSSTDQGISVVMCPNCKYTTMTNGDYSSDNASSEDSDIAGMMCVNGTSCGHCGTSLKQIESTHNVVTEIPVSQPEEVQSNKNMEDIIETYDSSSSSSNTGYYIHIVAIIIALFIYYLRMRDTEEFKSLKNLSGDKVLDSSVKLETVCTVFIILMCPYLYIGYAGISYLFNLDFKIAQHK